MKRNLGINCNFSRELSPVDALPLIKEAGFDCYSISTCDPEEAKEIKAVGDALGLTLDHVYVYMRAIHEMWRRGINYAPVDRTFRKMIDFAAECGVKTVAFPVSKDKWAPGLCEVGLSRFDDLMLYAADRGVTLAIENGYSLGNITYMGDRYRSLPTFGLCYDSGHDYALTGPISFLDLFHKNTRVVRISDNRGAKGLEEPSKHPHLLPFDGSVDFSSIMARLNRNGYDGALLLDVFQEETSELSDKDFLALAYERIKRLSEIE